MNLYPRKVSSIGSERIPSAVALKSKLNTCGVLVMGRKGGASPEGPSASSPAEFYIYLDGTDPVTPRLGGVTEVMTSPGTGVALGSAIPAAPFNPRNYRGTTVIGSERTSSSVKSCGRIFGTNNVNLPAIGIMNTNTTKITYLYVTEPSRFLCYGDETAWQAGDATLKVSGTAAPASSGSLGNLRDGRTVFGNDDEGQALVVASGGNSGAFIFMGGDQLTAVALYIGPTGAPVFASASTWFSYASLTILTTTLPGGKVGTPYTTTLAAGGGTPPYTWAVASGTLPTSVTLAAGTGVLSGTPTVAGTYNFTISVTASGAVVTSPSLSIVIAP